MNRADAEDPIAEIGVFVGATSLKDVEARLCEAVATEVDRILALTAELDAFDVVELMRQREMTISPVLGLDPGFDGSGAAIELIALVMRTRGERKPATEPQEATRPNEVIAELHDCAKRLLRLAIYRAKVCEQLRGSDPLARLSAEYQSYLVGVRALQYDSIAAAHERELFDRPEIDEALRSSLGFTYREFVTTRDALQDRQNDILTALRDTTADIFTRAQAEGREPDVDESKILRRSFIDWLFLPGARAAFTATDIAAQSGLEPGLVERILNGFSVDFDPALDATRAVVDFLHARNPLGESGLLRSDGRHVLISGPIGGDSFRTTVEAALTNTPAWDRYDRTRRRVSETLAVTALERALDSHCFASSFEYFAPRAGTSMGVLGSECGHPNEAGDLVEADALFLVEDVAICLEVKGRSVARAARRGDVARLKTEIKRILGHGADQARRLESLIRENGGVWRADRTWLDLSQVRETHTVVAGLDYFGPLGVSLGDLGSSGLLGDGPLPWIASLHDLEVISRVVDRPAEFLLYLAAGRTPAWPSTTGDPTSSISSCCSWTAGSSSKTIQTRSTAGIPEPRRRPGRHGHALSGRLDPRSSALTPTDSMPGCIGSRGATPTRQRSQFSTSTRRPQSWSTSSPTARSPAGSASALTSSLSAARRNANWRPTSNELSSERNKTRARTR